MAPFARGRGSVRGTQRFQPRGRGRGRGRGNVRVDGKSRSTFISTRVEGPLRNDSDGTNKSSEAESEPHGSVSEESLSESEDEIGVSAGAKPYGLLLQSLNCNSQRGQPQRKKRKVEDNEDLKEDELEQDLDLVEEPEEVDLSEFAYAEDADDLEDAEDGKAV